MSGRMNIKAKIKNAVQIVADNSLKRTEIIKLNVETSNLFQEQQKIFCKIGEYVTDQGMLGGDEVISNLKEEIARIKENIEKNQEKVKEIRGIKICSTCSVEVSVNKKICPGCGAKILDINEKKDR